jgi:hypothetical protein
MSPQHIEIVALQWAAIHEPPVPEVTMTSPYLDHVRSTRKIIEDLIVAREVELAKTTAVAQWQRVERELSFLHDELARLDADAGQGGSGRASTSRRR